jgi:hypothetical protein
METIVMLGGMTGPYLSMTGCTGCTGGTGFTGGTGCTGFTLRVIFDEK